MNAQVAGPNVVYFVIYGLALIAIIWMIRLLIGQSGKQGAILQFLGTSGAVERNVLLCHFAKEPLAQYAYLNALERLVERRLVERREKGEYEQYFSLTPKGQAKLQQQK